MINTDRVRTLRYVDKALHISAFICSLTMGKRFIDSLEPRERGIYTFSNSSIVVYVVVYVVVVIVMLVALFHTTI